MNELTTTQPQALGTIEAGELDRNPAAVYLAGLNSKRSQATQLQALGVVADLLQPGLCVAPERPTHPGRQAAREQLAEYDQARLEYKQLRAAYDWRCLLVDWGALRFQHTAAIRARLAGGYAPKTANRILAALRGVLKAAWRLELMTAEEYQRAADLEAVTGETLPAGRALGGGEILALVQVCESDPTNAGVRDVAMLACLCFAGLRRDEVAALDLADYAPDSGALTVRHGKRNKARITYLTNGAGRALRDWLALRGDEPGPLFWPIGKTKIDPGTGKAINPGKMVNRRMTNQAVYNVLAKRAEQAGIKDLSPHDLRRTFISEMLDAGADIATVAGLAGHASVTTTQKYDRRPEAAKQKAAGLLHMPYHGRRA